MEPYALIILIAISVPLALLILGRLIGWAIGLSELRAINIRLSPDNDSDEKENHAQ